MNKLAIIIPYYKFTFFRETLASLGAQTDQRFHVYIGNDGSPENPEELLKEFEGQFSFTYKNFENNLGGTSLTKQWERCIAMMGGEEWLTILGDDDVLPSNFAEEFYTKNSEIENLNVNVIKYASVYIDEGSLTLSTPYFHNPISTSPIEYINAISGGRSSLSEHVFRRSSYKIYKFFDFPLAWHADDYAVLQISNFGKIFCINEAVVQFRISSQNISGSSRGADLKFLASKTFYEKLISEHFSNFTSSQKALLLNTYEAILKRNKKLSSEYAWDLFLLNIQHVSFISALRFGYRCVFK